MGIGTCGRGANRRAVYADGRARMLGAANRDFRGLEGSEDHGVDTLFFRDESGKLIALAVDVPCPAQQAVGRVTINADFWHPVRESLHKRYGAEVCVLGWIGAAGDQCPALPFAMYDLRAEERMRKLRRLTQLEEIARASSARWTMPMKRSRTTGTRTSH